MWLIIDKKQAINLDRIFTFRLKERKTIGKFYIRFVSPNDTYEDITLDVESEEEAQVYYDNLIEDIENCVDGVIYGLRGKDDNED